MKFGWIHISSRKNDLLYKMQKETNKIDHASGCNFPSER